MSSRVRQLRPFVAPLALLSPLGLLSGGKAEAWWGCDGECSLDVRYENSDGNFVVADCCSIDCQPPANGTASCAECTCDNWDLDSGDCLASGPSDACLCECKDS